MTNKQKQEVLLTLANVIRQEEDVAAFYGGYMSEEKKQQIEELRAAHHELYKLLWGIEHQDD